MIQFALWLEFEHWEAAPGDDPYRDFFNMQITLSDGQKYALNVWTFGYLEEARRECQEQGEHLQGAYLPAPDLFVEKMERALLERIIADLLATDGLKEEWLVPRSQALSAKDI